MKRKLVLFNIMTMIMFIFTYFFHLATWDEIWNYGFSYNIAKGSIPYKEFNMIDEQKVIYEDAIIFLFFIYLMQFL